VNIQNLNQKIILQLGFFGVLMGIVTIMGWGQNMELFIWLFMIVAASVIIKKNVHELLFTHCMLIGLSWGVDCTIVQVLFFDLLNLNNPSYGLNNLNLFLLPAEILLIMFGTAIGTGSGFLLWGIQRLIKKLNL
jgi:hypothetical protein